MYRKLAVSTLFALMLGSMIAPAALASVPKVMVLEDFGTTW